MVIAAAPRHLQTIRVRYAESDQMGFAHHGAYVVWLEEARISWLRAVGASYRALEESGVFMPVVECTIRYRKSLRFDDVAELETTVSVRGPSRMSFTTIVRHEGVDCAEGTVTVAAVTRAGRPTRIPADVLAALDASN
ncbi:MAG: acyl-CoA thioesterase [Planctomycetes bacterium]|nr:acyl-CoA thioesterase [Planctomycetota bacterium]